MLNNTVHAGGITMTERYHGRIIEFKENFSTAEKQAFLKSLPQRSDFIDPVEHAAVIEEFKANRPVLFKPNDIYEGHFKTENRLEYKPILFGVLRDGSKAAIVLTDVDVSFEIQVPLDAEVWSFTDVIRGLLAEAGVYSKEITATKHLPGKLFHEEEIDYIKVSFYTTFQRRKALDCVRYKSDGTSTALTYKRKSKFGGGTAVINGPNSPRIATCNDDETCYYRKIARENKIQLCGWNWIRQYRIVRDDTYVRRMCVPYCMEVTVQNIIDTNDVDNMPFPRPSDCPAIDVSKNRNYKDLLFDKSMICGWDLETYAKNSVGNVPEPIKVFGPDGKTEEDIITLDSHVFSWHWSKRPLLVVALSIIPSPPLPGALIIRCDTQRDLIMIKALLLEKMCPEWLGEFNGGSYDWPFILRRAEKFTCNISGQTFPLTEFMKLHMSAIAYDPTDDNSKYRVRGEHQEQVKIEAGINYEPVVFQYPGTICIDIRGTFMQIYPKAEKSSLNYFLGLNKLKSKEDMPYQTMFKIVKLLLDVFIPASKSTKFETIMDYIKQLAAERGTGWYPVSIGNRADAIYTCKPGETTYGIEKITIGEMIALVGGPAYGGKISEGAGQVVNYCNEDAAKIGELMLVRAIIPDKRAKADLSYTSMFDSLYRADGMKVRNLVMAVASEPEWNLAFSNIGTGTKDERKYPGAYVVAPKKGLYRDHKTVKRYRRRQRSHQSIAFSSETTASKESKESKQQYSAEFAARIDPKSPTFDRDLLNDVKHEALIAARDRMAAAEAIYTKIANDESDDTDRPCTGLDFSSLYPSLMMTYNFSPEKVVLDADERDRLTALGYELIEVNFKYGIKDRPDSEKEDILAWIVQHKHPARAILIEEVARAKAAATAAGVATEHGWYKFVDKKVIDSVRKRFRDTTLAEWKQYGMGIYPYVLKQLFDKRAKVKKLMEHYSTPREMLDALLKKRPIAELCKLPIAEQKQWLREALDTEIASRKERYEREKKGFFKWKIAEAEENKKFFIEIWLEGVGEFANAPIDELYAEMIFKISYYNTVQLALKVYMNTFYGEAGNQLSAFFIVAVAGGITTYGQKNLRMVKSFVEEAEFKVLYGDTDSLYTCCPEYKFADLDKLYMDGTIDKRQYWTRMIELTMEIMDEFKQDVNNYLMLNNKTPFLSMAYEEALWPYCKFGKKKYIGVQHQNVADLGVCMPECNLDQFMSSRSLMIRGLQIVTRGASEFLKRICFDIFRKAFCITEIRTLREIVEDSLGEIVSQKWDPSQFVKSAKYKQPGRNPETGELKQGNVSVLRFMERMGTVERTRPEFGIKVPDIGERFKFVVVKRYPWKYDVRGNQVGISMADRYEFFESLSNTAYADSVGGLEVDMDHYVCNEIIGQLARIIIYHPDYDHFFKPDMTDEEYKKADAAAWSYAKKTLTNYYEEHFGTKWIKKGKVHKTVFKGVNNRVLDSLNDTYGTASQLFALSSAINTKDTETDLNHMETQNDVINLLVTEAKKLGAKWADPIPVDPLLRSGVGGTNVVKWFRELKMDPFSMQVSLILNSGSYYRTRKEYLDRMEARLNHAIRNLIPKFQTIYKDSLETIVNLVTKVVETNNIDKAAVTPTGDEKELEMEISFDSLEIETPEAQDIVFELHDAWIELISCYKQLSELESLRDNLKDLRTMTIDKTAVPASVRKRTTKDEFMNWLSKNPMTIDTSI
jgi:DNA polymerase elongation subunit (family B)